jgi:hypothetical protein
VDGQVLEEVSQVTFVRVMRSLPSLDVGVSGQELSSDSVISGVRVNETSLEDHRLEVFIDECDYTWLGLVDFIKSQIFWHVKDLWSIK